MRFWAWQAWLVLQETFRIAFRANEVFDTLARLVPMPLLVLIAAGVQGIIPGVKNLYPWAFPLMVGVVVFTLSVFATAARLQGRLSLRSNRVRGWELKTEGERLQSRMVYQSEDDIDRYSDAIDVWRDSVRQWLGGAGSELDYLFLDDRGIEDRFPELSEEQVPAKFLPVHKNYLNRRLSRIQEILHRMSSADTATPRPWVDE